ncbi:MAG: TIGR00730 family Rossman fold protein [Clostridiales bacterium]|nr:TIGR00730 family Rossman fold protein [Clostridiales bacterium]
MKICVFGAASAHINEKFIKAVEELGESLAKRGHSLVFGAGATGMMGAAARGVKRGGGYIHGVIPKFFNEFGIEIEYPHCDKVTYTETMSERKRIMEDDCDAFIITPGGVGTFEEFYEVLTLKQLGRHNKAIAIFNLDNYFDDLESFMQTAVQKKFITKSTTELYEYFNTVAEVLDYIENYSPNGNDWKKFKLGD